MRERLESLKKSLYDLAMNFKNAKPLQFALLSNLIDDVSTGIHMYKFGREAIESEANWVVRDYVKKYGIAEGLLFYDLAYVLPPYLAMHLAFGYVLPKKLESLPEGKTYSLLKNALFPLALKTFFYARGMLSLFGAYSWIHTRWIKRPINIPFTTLLLPFYIAYPLYYLISNMVKLHKISKGYSLNSDWKIRKRVDRSKLSKETKHKLKKFLLEEKSLFLLQKLFTSETSSRNSKQPNFLTRKLSKINELFRPKYKF